MVIALLCAMSAVRVDAHVFKPTPAQISMAQQQKQKGLTSGNESEVAPTRMFVRRAALAFVGFSLLLGGTFGAPQVFTADTRASVVPGLVGGFVKDQAVDLLRGELNRAINKSSREKFQTEAIELSCDGNIVSIPPLSEKGSFTPEQQRYFSAATDIVLTCRRINRFEQNQKLLKEIEDPATKIKFQAEQEAELASILDAITLSAIRLDPDPNVKYVENIRLLRMKIQGRRMLREAFGPVTMDNLDEFEEQFIEPKDRIDFSNPPALNIDKYAPLLNSIEEFLK